MNVGIDFSLVGRRIENAWRRLSSTNAIKYVDALLFLLAGVSLTYAAVTAPHRGVDLEAFQSGAQSWLAGTYRIGDGPMYEYPPFAPVVLAPLAFPSFSVLAYLWLLLNLAASAWIIYAAIKLWGEGWPARACYYLLALLLVWAPFRVAVRNGQLSLIITALLLGTLLARRRGREYLAGCLLGLALCKYSLSLPFLFYFAWKKEWKVVAPACLLPLLLTEVFALRLGLSIFEAVAAYAGMFSKVLVTRFFEDTGATEIQLLFVSLTGGNRLLTTCLTVGLIVMGVIAMAFIFRRKPADEHLHFAILSLFSLWSVYHRTYDAVLCIIPAALLIDFVVRRRHLAFSAAALGGLSLLALSLPGLLTERLGLKAEALSHSVLGFVGLHLERFIVLGLFCGLLAVLTVARPPQATEPALARVH